MLEGVLAARAAPRPRSTIPGYELAGKTGHRQQGRQRHLLATRTTSRRSSASRPRSDPQIEAIVVVDQPSTGFVYGTEVAAPAWKQIMNFALPYLKIPPH